MNGRNFQGWQSKLNIIIFQTSITGMFNHVKLNE